MEKIAYGSNEHALFIHAQKTPHVYVRERIANPFHRRWIFMEALSDLLGEGSNGRTQPGNHLEAACLFGRLFSCAVRIANNIPVLESAGVEVDAEEQMAAIMKDALEGGKGYVAALVSLFSSNLLRDANATVPPPTSSSSSSARARSAPKSLNIHWSIEDEFFHFSRGVEAFFSKLVVFKTNIYVSNKYCDNMDFMLHGTFFEELVQRTTTFDTTRWRSSRGRRVSSRATAS